MTALLLLDVESGGLDPKRDPLIEVAACLYDAIEGVPIESASMLLASESNAAFAVNGIPPAVLSRSWCVPFEHVEARLRRMLGDGRHARGGVYCVAHNAAFDRAWLGAIGRDAKWICTQSDVDWPRVPGGTGSLTTIALAYGVGVARAHRAVEDVLTLAAILSRVHEIEHGLDAWLARALEPKRELVAMVAFADNDLARAAGFRWQPDRKVWSRNVRVSQLETFAAALPFRTRRATEPQPTLEGIR